MLVAEFGTGQVVWSVHKTQEHQIQAAQEGDAALRQYVENVSPSAATRPTEEIARLADLHAQGVIDDAEFQQAKALAA